MIKIYIDGACLKEGYGGWGAVVIEDGKKTLLSGMDSNATSNRMELIAAIESLKMTPPGSEVEVYSDSQYLVHSMQGKFRRRQNFDLWSRLDELSRGRKVGWRWVGREDLPEMIEAHNLAEEAARRVGVGISMVDVSAKPVTAREAVARARVWLQPATVEAILKGETPKGDVFVAARLAGIMATKQTPHLIPLCHPVPIEDVRVNVRTGRDYIEIETTVRGEGKTGMEMEALTAASIAALTVYDMCKGVDLRMKIEVKLIKKSGGKSGTVILEE